MRQGEVMFLEIPSSTEYVSIARRAIEGIARRMTFTANEVEELKLAVGEACTNAVKYGPPDESPNVEIKCMVYPDGLEVEIRNCTSRKVHPHIPTKLDDTKECGRGLYMMSRLVDEMDMKWDCRSATVKLFKKTSATAV